MKRLPLVIVLLLALGCTQATAAPVETATPSPAPTAAPVLIGGVAYPPEQRELTAVLTEAEVADLDKLPHLERVDLTGSTCYEAMDLYRRSHPEVTVLYTLPIGGAQVSWDATELTMHTLEGADLLYYLPNLQKLTVLEPLSPAKVKELFTQAEAEVAFSLYVGGMLVDGGVQELDLSALSQEDISQAIEAAAVLEHLQRIELSPVQGKSPWTQAQVAELMANRPEAAVSYSTEAFGVKFNLTDEIISFNRIDLSRREPELRELLPLLSHAGRLDMEDCGLPDETMAALRAEFASPEIVWRINCHGYTCRTDVIMIRFSDNTLMRRLTDEYTKPLTYCNKVKYLDLGHNAITDAYFVAYMPDLEVCILSVGEITDISALKNCPNLEYLEIFTGHVTDISALKNCKKLKHLNMCRNEISDLSPLFELNLERLFLSRNPYPPEQLAAFRERFPQCEVNDTVENPTAGTWRNRGPARNPTRYDILRKQFSYDHPGTSSYSVVPEILRWW